MSLVSLNAELQQALKLTPRMLQSMEILQMNSQELLEYLNKISEENPILEQSDSADLYDAYLSLQQKASWINGGVFGNTFSHEEASMPEVGVEDRELESLSAFLCDQLDRMSLAKPILTLSKYLAELVDEDGYLAQEDIDELAELNLPRALISQAIETLQSLDPAGVGAKDLSECLLLQLTRKGDALQATMEIAAHFLPELSRKHYASISRALNLTISEIQAAEKEISALDPHPGRAFQSAEPVLYIRPDVFIVELDGTFQVVLNEYYLPRITISPYYLQLCKDTSEAGTREYLRLKLLQAKWLLNSLDRRGKTLQQCSETIFETQRAFFSGETTELVPMTLYSLSESLHLHPSTISRTVQGKYLQCRQGTYPLRYFFSRAIGQQGSSQQAIKQRIVALIQKEDSRHPLSDQAICQLLAKDSISIARRTVAKYRLELGIASSSDRKQKNRF